MLTVNDESGIDKSTRKKIDTGQYYIDAEIDLHGLTKDEAFQALVHFVDKNFLDHKRLLLVITGKGKKSNEGSVKLKDEFPKWINHEYLNGKVVRFSYAAKHHGGDGAYYVFLRRERGR
jgi:DNA-nicking Smr family endonuclease